MKILKKTWVYRSVNYFTIFLMAYYYIIFCLFKNQTTISIASLTAFVSGSKGLIALFVILNLIKGNIKIYFYSIGFFFFTLLINVFYQFSSTDKYFIISYFLICSFAFVYMIILREELSEPLYCPKFNSSDLDENGQYLRIPCIVTNAEGKTHHGLISNWSNGSVFIKLMEPAKLRGKVVLNLATRKNSIAQAADIYTEYAHGQGYGASLLNIKLANKNALGWADLYGRIDDMGL